MTITTRIRAALAAPMAKPAIAAILLAFVVACSGDNGGSGGSSVKVDPFLGDMVMGEATAPVEIIEYASLTCPHCRDFWKQDFPRLKANYIDTGKVRYILRDFPTPPAELAAAGAAIARCKGEDGYYAVVDDVFTRFADILDAARTGTAGPILVEIGAKHGLSTDEVRACINHKGVQQLIETTQREATDVRSTPTVFLNGEKLSDHRYPALAASIEAVLNPEAAAEGGADGETTETPAP